MSSENYIFRTHQEDREFQRLRRIEAALDSRTHELLRKTGVSVGWRCLEVGAGAGSILAWLGERVGISGHAVGVDRESAHLGRFVGKPYEIIEEDILNVQRVGAFNLIHARYVLIHNRNAIQILTHLKSLLRPGGHLVVEEPDFEAAEWIDTDYRAAAERVNRAIREMFSRLSLDPGYGKRLPEMLARLGFSVESVEARSHLDRGMGPIATIMADSAEALRSKYIATDAAAAEDVDRYIQGASDPLSWAIYYSTVGVVASKPEC
jgi:SAM-dependent methyltransferase